MNTPPLVTIAGLAVLLSACVATTNPNEELNSRGYLVTVPPTSEYGPGNLVWKKPNEKLESGQVALGYICTPQFVTFPGAPIPARSEDLTKSLNRSFTFAGSGLGALGLSASAKYADSVSMQFSNTEILEYSLEDLVTIQETLGPKCQQILNDQRSVDNAFQVVSAFKADLDYKVTFSAGVEVGVKPLVYEELKAAFGVDFSNEQGRVGKGLYYGVFLKPANQSPVPAVVMAAQ